MLKLKLATDPRWVNIAEKNIEEILTDHAFCEQKAASSAISIVVHYPSESDLVTKLLDVAQEELEHFQMVHDIIVKRGFVLGKERKDPYIHDLRKFFAGGGSKEQSLINKLLLSAMIEARSCERFKVLSEHIKDEELSKFYHELMISEAGHYTLFLGFARKYGEQYKIDVDAQWQKFLDYEATVIQSYGTKEHIHG